MKYATLLKWLNWPFSNVKEMRCYWWLYKIFIFHMGEGGFEPEFSKQRELDSVSKTQGSWQVHRMFSYAKPTNSGKLFHKPGLRPLTFTANLLNSNNKNETFSIIF